MIVGTAGHIDHGKTALLKALTGTDADRLPEEKSRGITIDLGFAYQHFTDCASVSFLDVPGHEKLVRTMVAGAIGIDFVLLVVAADDGPMPQTIEHLTIVDLIGVRQGAIAITKTDRVSRERLDVVEAAMRRLVAGTALEDAQVVACSAMTGEGIGQLSALLFDAARSHRQQSRSGHFRLAVDRCFSIAGAGLVVTGTVYSGEVTTGDELLVSSTGARVRVRAIRCENLAADAGGAGQRCALNLTGRRLAKDQIKRGDWVLAPELHAPFNRIDVEIKLVAQEIRALGHWTPVHVHIGASDVPGRVSLLDTKTLEPGAKSLAQLVLEHNVEAVFADRFILRDQSATRTIGGGRVLDRQPPRRRVRTEQRLQVLQALRVDGHNDALTALLTASPAGVDAAAFRRNRNLTSDEFTDLHKSLGLVDIKHGAATFVVGATQWGAFKSQLIERIKDHQLNHPDSGGATLVELERLHPAPDVKAAVRPALAELLREGAIAQTGQLIHLPGHEVALTVEDETLFEEIEHILTGAGADQPRVTVLAERLGLRPSELTPSLDKLCRAGRLSRVSKAYYVLPDTVARFTDLAHKVAAEHPTNLVTVGKFREESGVTRHFVMPLLEYLDRIGLTRKYNVGRQIRADWHDHVSRP